MLPFLDEEGLAQLWLHVIARLNKTASDEELAMLEASLRSALSGKIENLSDLDVAATANELNYIKGVTSPIQDQINTKTSQGHIHLASDITSGTISDDRLPITSIVKGGTNATTAEGARTNLDVYSTSQTQSLINEVYNHVNTVKNDLLNGAGTAYDTLKELGDLIDDNTDAIDALEIVASGKVSKSGDTMTGSLTIGEGKDLCLQAPAGSADSGDIIYRDGSGVEIGRLWITDGNISFRNSDNMAAGTILHTQNYTTHLDGRYVNTAGDTMTGTLKIKSGDSGEWTEGIRIAPANNGWTSLVLGSDADSGTGTGAWSLHTYNNNFYLSHNGSSNGSPMITGIPNTGFSVSGNFNVGGTLELANSTWNKVGNDAYFGDNNTAGSFAIKGQNGYTNLKLVSSGGDSSCGYITYNQDQQCINFTFG